MKEAYPLQWPKGIDRTSLDDRQNRKLWNKLTDRQAVDKLEKELTAFGAFGIVVTRKDPADKLSRPDPSVAVYFSRREDMDFQWQEVLNITNPDPSLDDVNQAYRELAKRYHPDQNREDAENMVLLNQHRDNAVRYVKQSTGLDSTYCMAQDMFVEFKQNVTAIRNTIRSMRQMERDGSPRMVQRAMQGFRPALTEGKDVIQTVA